MTNKKSKEEKTKNEENVVPDFNLDAINKQNIYVEIGSLIREARVMKKVELSEISEYSRVSTVFLEMLENGEKEKLSEHTYYYGCIGVMCKYLNLPSEKILSYITKHVEESSGNEKQNKVNIYNNDRRLLDNKTKKPIKTGFLILTGIIILLLLAARTIKDAKVEDVGERFLKETEYKQQTEDKQ